MTDNISNVYLKSFDQTVPDDANPCIVGINHLRQILAKNIIKRWRALKVHTIKGYDTLLSLQSKYGLLRGDAKTRSEYYKNMNFVGAMNANEIRSLEDMNAYEGGGEYFVQMNI